MKPDYTQSILNIPCTLMAHYGIDVYHATLPLLSAKLKDKDHIVLVVLDGFGNNLLKTHLDPNGFMHRHRLMTLTSVFPSTTTAATTALLTGLSPYESGFLGWFQYFKQYDTYFTTFLGEDYYEPHKAIHHDFKDFFKRDTFLDQVKAAHASIDTAAYFPKPIDRNGYESRANGFLSLLSRLKSKQKTLSYFYVVEPDLTQHKVGPFDARTHMTVHTLENELEHLQKALPPRSCVIVTADHGLTAVEPIPLHEDRVLMGMLEHRPANEARATTFFVKPKQEAEFIKHFNAHYSDAYHLYDKETILKEGWYGFGKRHPFIDTCLGQFVAVATQNKFFTLGDSGPQFKGHHAGITTDEMIVPLIVFLGDDTHERL